MSTPVRCQLAVLRNVLVVAGAAAALAVAPASALAAPHASAKKKTTKKKKKATSAHWVFTDANARPNYMLAFKRSANGKLSSPKHVSTHGMGSLTPPGQPPFGLPNIDSSGSVNMTKDGRWVFAVNSGDNSVTSFKVTSSGLKYVQKVSSGGTLPISLTSSGSLLYVLNGVSGTISGLRISATGHLKAIPGSTKSLATPGGGGVPAEIGFAPGGGVITVTERYMDIIDTYKVQPNGTPGPVQANKSSDVVPFGFAYQSREHLLVSNIGFLNKSNPGFGNPAEFVSTMSSYNVPSSGALSPIDQAPPTKTYKVPTGGRAACWVVVTKNGAFAFVTNTLSNLGPFTPPPASGPPTNGPGSGKDAISRYAVGNDGRLTGLGNNESTQGPGFAADEALTPDNRYLYVVVQALMPAGNATSHIDAYTVGSAGGLTPAGSTKANLPIGVSGIAAN